MLSARRPLSLQSRSLIRALLVLPLIPLTLTAGGARDETRVSRFGEYRGYSQETYDAYVRTSFYLPMRDGVRLAVDVLRPARGDRVEEMPLPAVWTHTRYRRASKGEDGRIHSMLEAPTILPLVKHGYVSWPWMREGRERRSGLGGAFSPGRRPGTPTKSRNGSQASPGATAMWGCWGDPTWA